MLQLKPEVLLHPNIPKPLHGINPRTIKGQSWWDKTRKAVYAEQEHTCIACGARKSIAKYHRHIEAHESYTIDWKNKCVKVDSIIGLCHSCHNFIHSGRVNILAFDDKMPYTKAKDIMLHGFYILKENNLTPWWGSCYNYLRLIEIVGKETPHPSLYEKIDKLMDEQGGSNSLGEWGDWYLEFEGEKHYGFESEKEWRAAYR